MKAKSLIETICRDLIMQFNFAESVKNMSISNLIEYHFGIGMYIRNKYLWNNTDNVKTLSEYYNADCEDDISHEILKDFYRAVQRQSKLSRGN